MRSPSRGADTIDSGLLSVVEQQEQTRLQQQQSRYNMSPSTGYSTGGASGNQSYGSGTLVGIDTSSHHDALAELIASLSNGSEKSDGSDTTNTSSAWNTQVTCTNHIGQVCPYIHSIKIHNPLPIYRRFTFMNLTNLNHASFH